MEAKNVQQIVNLQSGLFSDQANQVADIIICQAEKEGLTYSDVLETLGKAERLNVWDQNGEADSLIFELIKTRVYNSALNREASSLH